MLNLSHHHPHPQSASPASQEEERNRILKAGGFISDGRVNGCLALSRAIGDLEFKRSYELSAEEQVVTANPELRKLEVQKEDEFLILACDGIWDVLSSQACVEFIRQKLAAGMPLKTVCEALCDRRARQEALWLWRLWAATLCSESICAVECSVQRLTALCVRFACRSGAWRRTPAALASAATT